MRDYTVESIPKEQSYEWLLNKHYAHRIPSISFSFGLCLSKELVGVCTYGQPPSTNLRFCCGDDYKDNVLELNRVIKNDGLDRNVQSWFISQTFKLLPKPLIVVSYADPNYGHHGYVYQALNFIYTGLGGETKEYIIKGIRYNSRHIKDYWFKNNKQPFDETKTIDDNFREIGGIVQRVKKKHRYVIFIGNKKQKRDMTNKLVYDILEYPKGNNDRYNTNYAPKIQGVLPF
jgi:hypothetical protein